MAFDSIFFFFSVWHQTPLSVSGVELAKTTTEKSKCFKNRLVHMLCRHEARSSVLPPRIIRCDDWSLCSVLCFVYSEKGEDSRAIIQI